MKKTSERIKIYSVLPRLFGNTKGRNKPNGTIDENGCGKMSDFDTETLENIKAFGFTHIWFIGVIEHATKTDFSKYNIEKDPNIVVKGEAGSPYAIKDYYDVTPHIADDPNKRIEEFKELIGRVHSSGLKVMIDFVPNHLSRIYKSDKKPSGCNDFGENDDTVKDFMPSNNFYYIPGSRLHLPDDDNMSYEEFPAKATGNDIFSAYPNKNDWYETVKLNYGIDYTGNRTCFEPIPDTWHKMYDILKYWASMGVDGFRCDMAQMVPVQFWQWVIDKMKAYNKDIVFLAEIYDKNLYRSFINAGFDYLYDKEDVYDTLKMIIKGDCPAFNFGFARENNHDIQRNMCYFLENHDEQRIASDFFASDAERAIPAMALVLLSGNNPYLHYFGQEIGEKGMDSEGFSGIDGRTTIFDYWSLPSVSRLKKGCFSDKYLLDDEKNIFHQYRKLLKCSEIVECFDKYYAIEKENLRLGGDLTAKHFAFVRYNDNDEIVLVVTSFSDKDEVLDIHISKNFLNVLHIDNNSCYNVSLSSGEKLCDMLCINTYAPIRIKTNGYGYTVLSLNLIR